MLNKLLKYFGGQTITYLLNPLHSQRSIGANESLPSRRVLSKPSEFMIPVLSSFCHLLFHRAPPFSGLPRFLFPGGTHVNTACGRRDVALSSYEQKYMAQPCPASFLDLLNYVVDACRDISPKLPHLSPVLLIKLIEHGEQTNNAVRTDEGFPSMLRRDPLFYTLILLIKLVHLNILVGNFLVVLSSVKLLTSVTVVMTNMLIHRIPLCMFVVFHLTNTG